MDCMLPGFSVHGIYRAKILGSVAFSFFGGSSQHSDWIKSLPLQVDSLLLSHLGDSYFSLYNALAWGRTLQKYGDCFRNHHLSLAADSWLEHDFSRTHSIEYKSCPRKSCYTSWKIFWYFNNWVYALDVLHGIPVCMCPHANGRTALDSQCSKFEDQGGNRRNWDLCKKDRISGSAKVFCHDRVVFYSNFQAPWAFWKPVWHLQCSENYASYCFGEHMCVCLV